MFEQLEKWLELPVMDAESDSVFWQDEYISKKLLDVHLDPNADLASRKPAFMDRSVDWINAAMPPSQYPRLLDLGCGPGLYAQRFARTGYAVTGVDFSRSSVQYARETAKKQGLAIDFYEAFAESRTWEIREGGFWRADRCLCIHAKRKYPHWTTLDQSLVITRGKATRYYIWNHCFCVESLAEEAAFAGFHRVQAFSDVAGQAYSEDSQTIAIIFEK